MRDAQHATSTARKLSTTWQREACRVHTPAVSMAINSSQWEVESGQTISQENAFLSPAMTTDLKSFRPLRASPEEKRSGKNSKTATVIGCGTKECAMTQSSETNSWLTSTTCAEDKLLSIIRVLIPRSTSDTESTLSLIPTQWEAFPRESNSASSSMVPTRCSTTSSEREEPSKT